MRSDLELVRRIDKLAVFLINMTEQIVQLSGVLLLQERLYEVTRLGGFPGQKVGLGQIVSVVIGRGVDLLRLLEQRSRLGYLSGLDIELAEIVICVVIVGRQVECSAKLLSRELNISRSEE